MNIVIIGATSGIGKALFVKYANADNSIGIVGRRANLLDKLSRQYPYKTITAKADVANLEEIEQAINTLHKELTQLLRFILVFLANQRFVFLICFTVFYKF